MIKRLANIPQKIKITAFIAFFSAVTQYTCFANPGAAVSYLEKSIYARNYPGTSSMGYGLIKSFNNSSTDSYVYDNAMAILAFTAYGDADNALTLINGLTEIYKRDKLPNKPFSFKVRYNRESLKVMNQTTQFGHNSYVLLALCRYKERFGLIGLDATAMAYDLADSIVAMVDPYHGGLKFRTDQGDTSRKSSTENSLAAYSALQAFKALFSNQTQYDSAAKDLKDFAQAQKVNKWRGTYFQTGYNDPALRTDVQALAALCLGDISTLEMLDGQTRANSNGGYTLSPPNNSKFVWSEGSCQMALAWTVAMDMNSHLFYWWFQDPRFARYTGAKDAVRALQKSNGGIADANINHPSGENYDFDSNKLVAAGTAWYILAWFQDNVFKQ